MSFGVVPLETSAWKPEIAPQAMVMNTNGNTLPPKIGPVPSHELRDGRHLDLGRHDHDGDGEQHDHAELQERGEVVARREQQPHRQDGREPAVDDDEACQRHARIVEPGAQRRVVIDPAAAHTDTSSSATPDRAMPSSTRPGRMRRR